MRLERRGSGVGTGAGQGAEALGREVGDTGSWAEAEDIGSGAKAEDTGSEAEAEDTAFGADTNACLRERPAREAHERGTFMRCTPVRCTPLRDACPCEIRAPARCTTVSSLTSTFLCSFGYWTHFGFRISVGKITTLLAVKSVDAGSTQACL